MKLFLRKPRRRKGSRGTAPLIYNSILVAEGRLTSFPVRFSGGEGVLMHLEQEALWDPVSGEKVWRRNKLLPLPGTESQFFSQPMCRLVTIPISL